MSELGKRQEYYAAQVRKEEEAKAELEELKAATKKRYDDLLKELKKLENPKRLGSLTVTWMQDGKEMQIGPTPATMTPKEFQQALAAVQRSVGAKLFDRSKIEQIKGELKAMPLKWKNEVKKIETRIYRAQQRQATAVDGTTAQQSAAIRQIGDLEREGAST